MKGMILPDLAGGTAVVTGAAGGIGRAVLDGLVEQGAFVFGIDRRAGPAADASAGHRLISCDLADVTQIKGAFKQIRSETDSLDYLVNVAGIDPKYTLEEGSEERWREVIDVNLRGCYLVIREAAGLLRRGKGKSVVNVSSINYRLGIPRRSIYAASKAGILGVTTGLARELGADGIRINTITPGWVFTSVQIEEYFTRPEDRAKYLPYLEERQAIRHHISPQDVALHVLFYLSEASAASTGHNCVVDAGWLLE